MSADDCPCGRPTAGGPGPGRKVRAYAVCCGRWHSGPEALQAPDAEALMRSRYSAYVRGLPDYLLATWHPTHRPASLVLDEPGLRWLGLEVKRHVQTDAQHATVSFVARSRLGGRATRLAEDSRFLREADGRWYYLDGDVAR